jgi:hypothetical protein
MGLSERELGAKKIIAIQDFRMGEAWDQIATLWLPKLYETTFVIILFQMLEQYLGKMTWSLQLKT